MSDGYVKENLKIAEGDIVSVNFNGSQVTLCRQAKVLSKPCATGDSWVFQDLETDDVHYVSEGCTVTKHIYETR